MLSFFFFFLRREVWPENDSFGSAFMAPEEEFMAMRDIFLADIQGKCIACFVFLCVQQ